jgi:hypothetical protein
MANHGANKSKRKFAQPPAEDRYYALEVHKQLACYRFWCHLVEGRNTKLWDPNKTPASIWNWRSSNYLKYHIEEGSWKNCAKVSYHDHLI